MFSKEKIENTCKELQIRNYTINNDGSLNVRGNVNLTRRRLKSLPLKFKQVAGYFQINRNRLTSLKGCPEVVGGIFDCSDNRLKTLKYCPKASSGFDCSGNELISLKWCPKIIKENFNCSDNDLPNLVGSPEKVSGDFNCEHNFLETLKGGPFIVTGNYSCVENNINDVAGFPIYFNDTSCVNFYSTPVCEILELVDRKNQPKFIKFLNEYDVIREGCKIVEMRLEEAYWFAMKEELPMKKRKFENYKLI